MPDTPPDVLAVEAARLLNDYHCTDILIFDVRAMSQVTKYVVIATGTSDRQIKALAGHVHQLAKGHGYQRYGSDQDRESRWIVLDFVEAMVHLFEPATRAFYDLEMLWGDAPKVSWRREAGA